MRVVVILHETLRGRGAAARSVELDLTDGATVRDAAAAVGLGERDPWNAALPGRLAAAEDVLHDGDRLTIFEPILGG